MEPEYQTGIWNVPDEVLIYILTLVSPYKDLHHCAQVCHQWRHCVAQVVAQKKKNFLKAVLKSNLSWNKAEQSSDLEISKRYSHSAVYDETDNNHALYVFGGCTSTSTTFNDLWKLDTTSRTWSRPLATGAYPSPKACATLVKSRPGELMLFGGWSHPSPYPLHQSWRLFNEHHSYDINTMRWNLISPEGLKPPTMAGHSASVHQSKMVIFGGLQKTRNSIGHFSSSNDVWTFQLDSQTWIQEDIPDPKPKPRYGQSQLYLDEDHLLILGGCGGPSNMYNDVWLLVMKNDQHWHWIQCEVKNPSHGSGNMWCHPACKVGNYAIVLGKNIHPKAPAENIPERWNFIPQAQRGINRGYGAIRRKEPPVEFNQNSPYAPRPSRMRRFDDTEEEEEDMQEDTTDSDNEPNLAVDPVPRTYRSSVHLNIGSGQPSTSSGLRRPLPRMQAFSVGVPSGSQANPGDLGEPSSKRKQIETRQKQLESLKKMEEKFAKFQKDSKKSEAEKQPHKEAKEKGHQCSCHKMSMFVMDISEAISAHTVEWITFYSNNGLETPEVAILYSLSAARSELIMFGGIQRDQPQRNTGAGHENDRVTNALYFLTPPSEIV